MKFLTLINYVHPKFIFISGYLIIQQVTAFKQSIVCKCVARFSYFQSYYMLRINYAQIKIKCDKIGQKNNDDVNKENMIFPERKRKLMSKKVDKEKENVNDRAHL